MRFNFFFLSFLILLQLISTYVYPLLYLRQNVTQGEVWRLLTGGLVHSNLDHLLMNIAAILLLQLFVITSFSSIRFLLRSLYLIIGINIAIYYFIPHALYYLGFSGALYGVYLWYSFDEWQTNKLPLIFCLGLIGKILLDMNSMNFIPNEIIKVPVFWPAHLLGIVLAMLGILIEMLARAYR